MEKKITPDEMLDDILARHIAYNEELFTLIKNERQYIIHSNIELLEEATEKKISLKSKITKLEKSRAQLMPYLAHAYSLKKETITLSELISVVGDDYRERYEEKQTQLRALLKKIQHVHEGNKRLVEKAINFQERMFMLFYGLKQGDVAYGASGTVEKNRKPLIDSVV